ncbi:MFS transporter [Pseudodesulfovibrio karagichevae]|uniref:MFS transporter n=1 Tax=Pseudodesulfovibrio karagichevae TaxID=3239305 RepID=A0ABV4K858_9BACT
MNLGSGGQGWHTGWLVLGLIALAVAALAGRLLRNHPRDKGIEPLGRAESAPVRTLSRKSRSEDPRARRRTIAHLGIIYLLFGATSVIYATFIVTALVDVHHYGEGAAGRFWAVVGGLSILPGPLFGALSDRMGRRFGMIVVFSLFTAAYAFAAMNGSSFFLYASVVIFGIVAWSIPTIMSAAVGDYMGPDQAVRAFGLITLFFGAGQIVGPVVAGYLADLSGDFNAAFRLCAALTACAVALTALLRQPE